MLRKAHRAPAVQNQGVESDKSYPSVFSKVSQSGAGQVVSIFKLCQAEVRLCETSRERGRHDFILNRY